MNTAEKIAEGIIVAQKAKDSLTLATLRSVKAGISNAALLKGNINTTLEEAEVIQVIRKQVAQRQDSAAQYEAHGAIDKANQEKAEIAILEAYLPAGIPDDQLDQIIADAIQATGATTRKDMGAVMKIVREKTEGRADGKTLSSKIQNKLT